MWIICNQIMLKIQQSYQSKHCSKSNINLGKIMKCETIGENLIPIFFAVLKNPNNDLDRDVNNDLNCR